MNKCSIPDCDNPAIRLGYCNAHYLRFKRHGDPLTRLRRPPASSPEEKKAREKEWRRIDYERHKDAYIARAKKHNTREAYIARRETYFSRPEIKEQARIRIKAWTAANPERKRAMDKAFAQKNPGLVTSYKAKRRALTRQASPPWLTEEHRAQMAALYIEAARLTKETGIRHEVDHIIPLEAGAAHGLHLPWNLRILTRDANNRRQRKFSPEELTALQPFPPSPEEGPVHPGG